MAQMVIEAEPRKAGNKNDARRLRRAGCVPGVLYGAGDPGVPLALNPKQLQAVLESQAGHNTILDVKVKDGETTRAMIVDWQYEPVHGALLHVDLQRITMDRRLRVTVPVLALGEPAGVKNQGGILEYVVREIEVECLPGDIPERIQADVSELVIGMNLRVKNLRVDPKVRLISDPEQVVLHVVAPKAEEEKPAETVEAAAPAEPEVIRKGKVEKEEEELEPAEAKKKEGAEAKKKEGAEAKKKEGAEVKKKEAVEAKKKEGAEPKKK